MITFLALVVLLQAVLLFWCVKLTAHQARTNYELAKELSLLMRRVMGL